LTFFLLFGLLQPLESRQKPGGFRPAINHGANSLEIASAWERQEPPAACRSCPRRNSLSGPSGHAPLVSAVVSPPARSRPFFRLYQSYITSATTKWEKWKNAQLQPEVAPQVSHLQQAPLRIKVNWPHSVQGSPSYPFKRARRILSS